MSFEKPGSDRERDPQIEQTWFHLKQRFDQIKKAKQIGGLLDSMQTDSMASGNEIVNATQKFDEPLRNLLEAADKWEKETEKELAKTLHVKYGDKIGFRISDDGTLELSNGIVYGKDK